MDGDGDDEWFAGSSEQEQAAEQSAARRAAPLATTLGFLRETLRDNTEEEARAMWMHRARLVPAWAQDVLWCLDQVAQSPPQGLQAAVNEGAQIQLYHEGEPPRRYGDAEVAAWLAELARSYAALL